MPHLETPSSFRHHIVQPYESGDCRGRSNLRSLLKTICLRRSKQLLDIREPKTISYKLSLTADERSVYKQIGEGYRRSLDDALCRGNPSQASRYLFQALLRLRVFSNHGVYDNIFYPTERRGVLPEVKKGSNAAHPVAVPQMLRHWTCGNLERFQLALTWYAHPAQPSTRIFKGKTQVLRICARSAMAPQLLKKAVGGMERVSMTYRTALPLVYRQKSPSYSLTLNSTIPLTNGRFEAFSTPN